MDSKSVTPKTENPNCRNTQQDSASIPVPQTPLLEFSKGALPFSKSFLAAATRLGAINVSSQVLREFCEWFHDSQVVPYRVLRLCLASFDARSDSGTPFLNRGNPNRLIRKLLRQVALQFVLPWDT